MGKQITDYFLYRRRYILGYTTIGVLVLALLLLAGLFTPGGISQAEMQSTVSSNTITLSPTFDPVSIVNIPYKILQRASLVLFGLSNFSIKLPSLILGALSVLGMLILFKTWFRRNVAVISMAIVITTSVFLFMSQDGTPSIVYLFWSIWLLVTATMVSRASRFLALWKVAFFGIVALSLYTPLSIYLILALIGAVILHPHLRYLVRRLSKTKLLLAAVCALVLLAPLIDALIREPSLTFTLLGIPSHMPNIWHNIVLLTKQYFDFATPSTSVIMTPIYSLGSIVLILLGVLRLFTTKYTARSYLISTWLILLTPAVILNPDFSSVSFVPIMLLMAMGVSTLIQNWYRLFPRNPYARVVGLIPLAILIGGMIASGFDRYVYGYLYDPNVAVNFSQDLTLVNAELRTDAGESTVLVVTSDEKPFYDVLALRHKMLTVQTVPPVSSPVVILTRNAYSLHLTNATPQTIVTDSRTENADRFYVYKTNTK